MERGRIDNGQLASNSPGSACRAAAPTVVFLPGFRSDMRGDKAQALTALCQERGQGLLLFDYSGHGESGGAFTDGTIGRWAADALAAIDGLTEGQAGAGRLLDGGLDWAAHRLGAAAGLWPLSWVWRRRRTSPQALMWQTMMPAERATLERDGVLMVPSAYGEPTPITLALIEEGRRHLLLGGPIPLVCPVRLLHGQADPDVPWEMSLRLAAQFETADVQVHLVKDGEHRLSRPGDLALLARVLDPLLAP